MGSWSWPFLGSRGHVAASHLGRDSSLAAEDSTKRRGLIFADVGYGDHTHSKPTWNFQTSGRMSFSKYRLLGSRESKVLVPSDVLAQKPN